MKSSTGQFNGFSPERLQQGGYFPLKSHFDFKFLYFDFDFKDFDFYRAKIYFIKVRHKKQKLLTKYMLITC
jgi:hypothetical protein